MLRRNINTLSNMEATVMEHRTLLVPFFILLLVLKNGDKVLAQHMDLTYQINQDNTFGPVLDIDCFSQILRNTRNHVVRWVFKGRTLAENGELIEADNSRYTLFRNGEKLLIKNLIEDDKGEYLCEVIDRTKGTISLSSKIYVDIEAHLPDAESLQCGINPALKVSNGSVISFNCIFGKSSNAGIEMELFWRRRDGKLEQMALNTTRRQVVAEDHGAILVCKMSSTTFPTAYYECVAGPIRFDPPMAAPTMPSRLGPMGKFYTPKHPRSPMKDNTGMLLGIVFGSIFLLVFFIVVVKGIESEKDVFWIKRIQEAAATSEDENSSNGHVDFLDSYYGKKEGV